MITLDTRLPESQNQSPATTIRSATRNTEIQAARGLDKNSTLRIIQLPIFYSKLPETPPAHQASGNNLNMRNPERIVSNEVIRNNLSERPVPARRALNRSEYVNNLDVQRQRQQQQRAAYEQIYQEQLQRHLLENSRNRENSNFEAAQQSNRIYEYTPTAVLLQNLFRRRQPRYMYNQQNGSIQNPEMESLTTATTVDVNSSPHSQSSSRDDNESPSAEVNNDDIYVEGNLLRNQENRAHDDDESSEYLSISNLSLNMGPERCETPPPAYKSLYDEKM